MTKYSHYEALKVEVKDRIAVATLNRPPYNAMNRTLIHEIHNVWAELTDDNDVYAIVLTGAGDYFSVGGDVKQMSERPGGDFLHEGEKPYRSHSRDMVSDIIATSRLSARSTAHAQASPQRRLCSATFR